ncbi:Zinc finger protein 530 [Eumeta japonica]|uniref:Zinc finger protein 530 n=1 Tax=Eumeta variegata TaxID=151549 RepID=A0A4C1ZU32_EUMVA|nr:Zinc finger protein 530 [Eumeta japonica]
MKAVGLQPNTSTSPAPAYYARYMQVPPRGRSRAEQSPLTIPNKALTDSPQGYPVCLPLAAAFHSLSRNIREICLTDKCDRKNLNFNDPLLLSDSGKNERSDDFYPENEQQQASFAWTEADGSLASLVSEPNFCHDLDLELDTAIKTELKESDASNSPRSTSTCRSTINWTRKTPQFSSDYVSSTSASSTSGYWKVDGHRRPWIPATSKKLLLRCRSFKWEYVLFLKIPLSKFVGNAADGKLFQSATSFGVAVIQINQTARSRQSECRGLVTYSPDQLSILDFGQRELLLPKHVIFADFKEERTRIACKVDKADPRSRLHFVKYLKRHGRTVKLWECGICSREFQHQYTLVRHLPTHTDERNFHCDSCGKSFRQLSTLSQHRAIHSTERPYECEAHPDDTKHDNMTRNRASAHASASPRSDVHGYSVENCEVSSSVGPNLPPISTMPWTTNLESVWELPGTSNLDWTLNGQEWPWRPVPFGGTGNGVVMDPMTTCHTGLAMASRQTPFALLKSETGAPLLVKMIDAILPGGKQVLVPATMEALKTNGDFIKSSQFVKLQPENISSSNIHGNILTAGGNDVITNGEVIASVDANVSNLTNNAVRVRTSATPAPPQLNRANRLPTAYEEPSKYRNLDGDVSAPYGVPLPPPLIRPQRHSYGLHDGVCSVPLAPPSPPSLSLMHEMDLFETIDCMPLGKNPPIHSYSP